MNNETCATCLHFCQHYILTEGRIMRVFCGHCIFPNVKSKRPFTKACENYIYAPPDEDAFADKNYLTKEMIRHLFEMEFLPSIEDASEEAIPSPGGKVPSIREADEECGR